MATVQNLTDTPVEKHTRLQAMPMAYDVTLEIADTISDEFPLEAHWLRNIARDCLATQPIRVDRRQT